MRNDIVGMEVLARLWQEYIKALVPLVQKPLINVFAMQCRYIRTLFRFQLAVLCDKSDSVFTEKEVPSCHSVTMALSRKERISFRDNPVQLSGGWGGGKKRSNANKLK